MVPAAAAYFPSLNHPLDVSVEDEESATIKVRPTSIAPVFDPKLCDKPLHAHSDVYLESNYRPPDVEADRTDPAEAPPSPADFVDPYLFPILNKNERLRLTMLWYMLSQALEDRDLMARLQEKVDLIRDFVGWEYCIMGVLDNARFTRIATAGIPLAILPRRESTCSHTINQPQGSIFWVSDMSKDWRFRESPHVAIGGLKSYAGTALLCHTIDGTEVPLGSLCVASDEPNRELSTPQQKALKRVAHMLVKEVITARRLARHHERQKMADTIQRLEDQSESLDFEDRLLKTLRTFYPTATVSIKKPREGGIILQDGSVLPVTDVQNCLWENVDLLEHLLQYQNHTDLTTSKTVRAVVSQAGTFARGVFLAIETSQVSMIFDDVDSWFVERCARLCWDASQRRLLAEAMQAKEMFLRGITHQLRTPIHGVLGAAELLAEELSIKSDILTPEMNGAGSHPITPTSLSANSAASPTVQVSLGESAIAVVDGVCDGGLPDKQTLSRSMASTRALQFLQTINSAGKELMTTVNNMLKLNRWADITTALTRVPVLCNIQQVESDLVKEIDEVLSAEEAMDVSLLFDNQLEEAQEIQIADESLLRDCIQALVINAIQWSPQGTVIVTIRKSETTLWIDVADNGRGISSQFHQLIFQPYEKVDQHTRGAGLGLTLASKIAEALGGRLSLAFSEMGKGSRFSLELPGVVLACDTIHGKVAQLSVSRQSTICRVVPDCFEDVHPLTAHLTKFIQERRFAEDRERDNDSDLTMDLDIINFTPETKALEKRLEDIDSARLTVCLVPWKAFVRNIDLDKYKKKVRIFHGPLTTRRMQDIARKLLELHSERIVANERLQTKSNSVRIVPKMDTSSVPRGSVTPIALLVDDNPINLTILRMFCRKRAIPYHEATDGEQAVQKFLAERNPPIDLILMDLQMPICDGIEATARIREIEAIEGLQPAALFMVTGQDSPKDKADSLGAGADEFMVKPVKMKALDEAINAYLGSSAGSTPS